MDLRELKKLIETYLTEYPEDSVYILNSVSVGLEKYKEKVDLHRGREAYASIDNLFNLMESKRLNSEQKCIMMSGAIKYLFPRGRLSASSINHKNVMYKFVKMYFNETKLHGSDWERNNFDPSYMASLKIAWMQELEL